MTSFVSYAMYDRDVSVRERLSISTRLQPCDYSGFLEKKNRRKAVHTYDTYQL